VIRELDIFICIEVETNCSDRLHLAPPNRGISSNSHFRGTRVPVEEPSTASNSDIAGSLDIVLC